MESAVKVSENQDLMVDEINISQNKFEIFMGWRWEIWSSEIEWKRWKMVRFGSRMDVIGWKLAYPEQNLIIFHFR